jgi:hypothetical protein
VRELAAFIVMVAFLSLVLCWRLDRHQVAGASRAWRSHRSQIWNASKSKRGITLNQRFRDIQSRTARHPLRY